MLVRGVRGLRVVGPASVPGSVSMGMQVLGNKKRKKTRKEIKRKEKEKKKEERRKSTTNDIILFFFTGMAFGEKGTDLIKEDHYL
jgi:hypothetical protein